jgi:hypothetical protein
MRVVPWLALGALLVAGGALIWLLASDEADPQELTSLGGAERGPRGTDDGLHAATDPSPQGGVYRGLVVDDADKPVADARVLLVRLDTGETLSAPSFRADGSDFDPRLVPTIGDYEVAGETRSDAQGRFEVAAQGVKDRVKMVVAWSESHAPSVVFTGKPEEDVRVVLQRGGHLAGKVVDPAGNPVAGALVQVFLQQIAPKGVNPGPEQGSVSVATTKPRPLAAAATLGDFLGKVLGPRVYGTDPANTEALQRITRSDGTFHLGPIDGTVQLEVVITHPDYMWTDFDEGEDGFSHRPVLKPGERLERTYQLREGNWIEGRVVSESDPTKGVEGVLIRLRHVVAYKKHYFYDHKVRSAMTREDGSFRLSGLSHGPFVADLFHPGFGSEFVGEIPANTKNLAWAVKSRGAIQGTIAGLTTRPPGGRVEVLLEPVGAQGAAGGTQRQLVAVNDKGVFVVERLPAGVYRVSLRAGTLATRPEEATVEAHTVVQMAFTAEGGAALEIRVVDGKGRAVDPATVTLVRLSAEGGGDTELGSFVSRAGRVEEDGLAPGRYRIEGVGVGYLSARSEPFELLEGRTTKAPTLVLMRPGVVRVKSVRDERGRAVQGDVTLEVREGEGEFRPLSLRTGEASLRPGPVSLRATDAAGRTWSESFELAEEEQRVVEVVLTGG